MAIVSVNRFGSIDVKRFEKEEPGVVFVDKDIYIDSRTEPPTMEFK